MSNTIDTKLAEIDDLANRLIETLGSMEASKADAIVRDVATALKTDILGKKGYVAPKGSVLVCGSNSSTRLADYEWREL